MKWVRRGVIMLLGAISALNVARMVDRSGARAVAAVLVALCAAVLILRLARWMEAKNERWWAANEEGRVELPKRTWPAVLGSALGVAAIPRLLATGPQGMQLAVMAFALGTCGACLYLFWNRSSLDPPEVREAMGKD